MAIALLKEPPLVPAADLGPYRSSDYEALPDQPRCELIYGRFYVSPSPRTWHQATIFILADRLRRIARPRGGKVFIAPLDVHLADHSVVQPDVIYISAERLSIVQDWIRGVPDLLVEVLSPGTARTDRGEKLRLYAESGVLEYWIIDPLERQIEFLRNEGGRFVVVALEGAVYRSQALPEVELDLVSFWREVEEEIG
jgi:Uma2 family endonuclease